MDIVDSKPKGTRLANDAVMEQLPFALALHPDRSAVGTSSSVRIIMVVGSAQVLLSSSFFFK